MTYRAGTSSRGQSIPRSRECSCAKSPQSVRFIDIVADPPNVSTRGVNKVSREVTETMPLICAPQAPPEMFLMKPLMPTPTRKQLIGKTHDDRARVDKVDKPNAEIVELKDDKSDIAKGTESKIDDVAKIEREKASDAKPMQSPRTKTATLLRNAIQRQMWNNREGTHGNSSSSLSSPAAVRTMLSLRPCTACSTMCC